MKDVFHEPQERALGTASKEEGLLRLSTSGGVFSTIAQEFSKRGAYVFGSAYDEDFRVVTVGTDDPSAIPRMYGSKYVFGDTAGSYRHVKELLDAQKTVLFSGTPCQVAGLRCYLGEERGNLYSMDLLCHGAPSAALFRRYLGWLEKRHGKKVLRYIFRDKEYGRRTIATVTFSDGSEISIKPNEDPYLSSFYMGKTYRHSCYGCKYARRERVGDITIGDYWGAEKLHPGTDISKGFSAVIVNTGKGREMMGMVKEKMAIIPTTVAKVAENNSVLDRPTDAYEHRDAIYRETRNHRFERAVARYMFPEPLWKTRLKSHVPIAVKRAIRGMREQARGK